MADTTAAIAAITAPEDLIGRYVIARCSAAGVHAGTLSSLNGDNGVTLTNSRRLWRWQVANKGAFLSGLATRGIDPAKSKLGDAVDIVLKDVCEIIPVGDDAAVSIQECPSHVAD